MDAAVNSEGSSSASLKDWLKQTVSRIAAIEIAELQDEVLIREELGIDSLKTMEIVARCEKELNIVINEGQLFDIRTVGEFFHMLEGIYREKSSP
jgi:acyl carrier protein